MEEMSVVLQCEFCDHEWTEGITTDELEDFVKGFVAVECPSCKEWQASNVIEEF